MRSTELHGERRSWNHHLVRWVVRSGEIFLEVWIFRNVWDQLQDFVTDHFSTAAAKREDGVAHQKHAGARLILVAYLVNSRLLDEFSRSQSAIALIKCFDVGVLQFHSVAFFCSFLPSKARRAWEQLSQSKMGCVQGSRKLERSGREKNFCWFLLRQPRAEGFSSLAGIASGAARYSA